MRAHEWEPRGNARWFCRVCCKLLEAVHPWTEEHALGCKGTDAEVLRGSENRTLDEITKDLEK